MKICYFGDYDSNYSRNKIIIKGLKQNGIQVIECQTEVRGRNFKKLVELYRKHKVLNNQYDLLIVGYSDSRIMIPFARLLSSKKVFWDAFYSLYDSWVHDRGLVRKDSLKARYYWFLDWLSCKLSNKILLDTHEHIKYFVETFNIDHAKFIKAYVGSLANEEVHDEIDEMKKNDKFKVFFYGNYIPLQGVEYIIKAAKILEYENDIVFELLGRGQTYLETKKISEELGVKNISFIDKTSYVELVRYIGKSDICLGIFGDTDKAKRVIPNKIYDAIALGKAVISGDTPAVRELFEDGKNIVLCNLADEKDLAEKILGLRNDTEFRKKIEAEAQEIFVTKLTPTIVTSDLISGMKSV